MTAKLRVERSECGNSYCGILNGLQNGVYQLALNVAIVAKFQWNKGQ